MGTCPLNPQIRAINKKNAALKQFMAQQLKDLSIYNFYRPIMQAIDKIPPRYLFNEGMIEDIDKIKFYASKDQNQLSQSRFMSFQDNLQEQLKQSCLILQDQEHQMKNTAQKIVQNQNPTKSFVQNMKNNQSLLVQINILYGKEYDITHYNQALKMFLKWVQVFNEHGYGGFLKPVYRQFCNKLYSVPKQQTQTIIDQTNCFVGFLVNIYIEIYGLKTLNSKKNGSLFKYENVFNLVMSYLFRRTKIKTFLRDVLKISNQKKISKFKQKLIQLKKQSALGLGVPQKFALKDQQQRQQFSNDLILQSRINQEQSESSRSPRKKKRKIYAKCIKMTSQLCCKSKTPITKLKLIVNIAKQIMNQIRTFYGDKKTELPEMDPDSLMTIIMFIIVKCGDETLLEQIKLVEYFTTNNCLNCISGYYLNMFLAAIEMILG